MCSDSLPRQIGMSFQRQRSFSLVLFFFPCRHFLSTVQSRTSLLHRKANEKQNKKKEGDNNSSFEAALSPSSPTLHTYIQLLCSSPSTRLLSHLSTASRHLSSYTDAIAFFFPCPCCGSVYCSVNLSEDVRLCIISLVGQRATALEKKKTRQNISEGNFKYFFFVSFYILAQREQEEDQ